MNRSTSVPPSLESNSESASLESTSDAVSDLAPTNPQLESAQSADHFEAANEPEFARAPTTFGKEALKYLVSGAILAIGVTALIWLSSMKPTPENVNSKALVPLVKTYVTESYAGQLDMVVSGSVVPFREIKVASEVGGTIIRKYPQCQAGNFVTKGTKLLEIDPTDYRLKLETIKKEIIQAQQTISETDEELRGATKNLELANNDFELARREYDRNRRLGGVLSGSEIDAAEKGFLASQTQVTARQNTIDALKARRTRLESTLDLTRSRLAQAELDLRRTTVFAPASGVIVADMAEEGESVNAKEQLLTFEDTSRSEVLCNLTASDLEWIRRNSKESDRGSSSMIRIDSWPVNIEGFWAAIQISNNARAVADVVYKIPRTTVTIYEKDNPDVFWTGILERFDGIGRDEKTKTIPCRIVVNNPVAYTESGSRALVRGMYVKCRVEVQASAGETDRRFLSFPEVALRPGSFVWIVRDRKLDRADVIVADRILRFVDGREQSFVVAKIGDEGLQEGDEIVVTPLPQPTVGAEVLYEEDLDKTDSPEEKSPEEKVEERTAADEKPDPKDADAT